MSGHFLTSYRRGTVAYFIPEVFQNLLAKIGFGTTLSIYNNILEGPEELLYLNFKYYGHN